MNIKEYIESGIVQDYCLGILGKASQLEVEKYAAIHEEVKREIEANEQALLNYAAGFAKLAPQNLKEKTMALFDNLAKEENLQINNLPILNRFSNRGQWLQAVKPMLPAELKQDNFFKILHEDDRLLQLVLWVKKYYPEEIHHDLEECFIILEGECECDVEGEIIKLGPGDFYNIPLHKHHDVKVTNGPVLAVVQRLKVA